MGLGAGSDYFYDKQIRRLILQTCRMLGGFEVHTGIGRDGTEQIRQVPCRWGEPSRMVSHIQRQLSENIMIYTPIMSIHITAINTAPDRRQNPTHVSTTLVDEREFDEETGQYTGRLGDRFTVKRYMPIPYNFTFQLDIWTSNQDQKMQILEQIMMLFNPSIDLQTSDNPLDWTAITFAQMEDAITWTSRSIPMGTDEAIDISTMQFLIPYWINPPAEETRRRAIETIITNMNAVNELPDDDTDFSWESGERLYQSIITPGNHIIDVKGNELTLLGSNGDELDEDGNIFSWFSLLVKYSDFSEQKDDNKLIVKRRFGDPDGVSGIISFTSEENKLTWAIDGDTLPDDTLDSIVAIIDPSDRFPGDGLDPAATGQRYLIADDIGPNGTIWGNIDVKENSIIEYNGTDWIISFDSTGIDAAVQQVITNNYTSKQLRWSPTNKDWVFAVDGLYKPGTWKIIA